MITDEEHERFNAWCREEARNIRHKAAALGHPAEYEYLRQYPFILERYKKVVPTWTATNMDSVLQNACDDSIEIDLVEVNRIRKEWDEPPLDFVPEVVGRMQFSPPKPKSFPPPDEQEAAFYAWAREEVEHACHVAAAEGIEPWEAIGKGSWMRAARIEKHFPGLRVSWCLGQLTFCVMWMQPENLDPAKVANIKSWSQTFQDVGKEIEKLAAEKSKPELKQ